MLSFLTSVLLCRYTPSPTLPPVQYTTQVWHLQCISSTPEHHALSVCLALCGPSIHISISTMGFCVYAEPKRSSRITDCLLQVVCPPPPFPKKSDPMDKFGMDPHDAKGFDSSSTFGKGGEMQKGDSKKDIPAPPPCYTVQARLFLPFLDYPAASVFGRGGEGNDDIPSYVAFSKTSPL